MQSGFHVTGRSSANEGADRDPQVLMVHKPWAKTKYQFEQPNVLKA